MISSPSFDAEYPFPEHDFAYDVYSAPHSPEFPSLTIFSLGQRPEELNEIRFYLKGVSHSLMCCSNAIQSELQYLDSNGAKVLRSL